MAEVFEPQDFVRKSRNVYVRHGTFNSIISLPSKRVATRAWWSLTHAASFMGLAVGLEDIVWCLKASGIAVEAEQ